MKREDKMSNLKRLNLEQRMDLLERDVMIIATTRDNNVRIRNKNVKTQNIINMINFAMAVIILLILVIR
jgi:hypothetical protein